MNKIYDFSQIDRVRKQINALIVKYVIFVLICLVSIAIACAVIDNNVLLTAVFALVVLCLALGSILLWKIKYGILKGFLAFLDGMETGNIEDFVGTFDQKISSLSDSEPFDTYVFEDASGEKKFLIHKQHKQSFIKGRKYHVLYVGNYLSQWESLD